MIECDSVAIVSGGLDSITLTYDLVHQGYTPHLLSFNYGQRHKKELTFAGEAAKYFGLKWDVVDLQGLTHLISNSALTSPASTPGNPGHKYDAQGHKIGEFKDIEVPDGHYAEDNMAATVVPNRNMIMLSIAAGVAVNYGYQIIGTGVHAGDHAVYPDCRPEFITSVAQTIGAATQGFGNWRKLEEDDGAVATVLAPYLYWSKAEIAAQAFRLGVPLHKTWSCYKGGENHCGRCGTCVERLEAIDIAKMRMVELYPETETVWSDATVYDDTEFWKNEIAKKVTND